MANSYCITTKVHSSSIMSVLHNNPGSFLLLVKNLLEYQDVKVDWKLSWEDLKLKLRKLYETSEEAFNQFSLGTAFITHASFESAMEPLGLEAGLELQIRWAELDLDCNGDVSYEEFSTLVGTWDTSVHREALTADGSSLEVDKVLAHSGSMQSTRSPRLLQPSAPRDMLRKRLADRGAVGEVATMVEKKLAESHASLERRFELLAKQLLEHGQHTPGVTSTPERCGGCCGAGRVTSSRKRESRSCMDVACSAGGRCLCLAPWSLKEEIEEAEAASRLQSSRGPVCAFFYAEWSSGKMSLQDLEKLASDDVKCVSVDVGDSGSGEDLALSLGLGSQLPVLRVYQASELHHMAEHVGDGCTVSAVSVSVQKAKQKALCLCGSFKAVQCSVAEALA
eukprot:symbB.v1.2.010518.t1/scaffold690.1/size332707/16